MGNGRIWDLRMWRAISRESIVFSSAENRIFGAKPGKTQKNDLRGRYSTCFFLSVIV